MDKNTKRELTEFEREYYRNRDSARLKFAGEMRVLLGVLFALLCLIVVLNVAALIVSLTQ